MAITLSQLKRLASGDFDVHDYVEINVGGTGPNQADFETLDTPHVVIRDLAAALIKPADARDEYPLSQLSRIDFDDAEKGGA
jgi:hypothetical protein